MPIIPTDSLGPTTPVGSAARSLVSARMQPLFDLEAAARGGNDADAVHDMRVASRRTREALAIFEPLYRTEDIAETVKVIRRITRALGAVRDADVYMEHFARYVRDADDDRARVAAAYLVGHRGASRDHDLSRMRHTLAGVDLQGRRHAMLRSLDRFRKRAAVEAPLSELARSVLATRLDAFLGHLPAALDSGNTAEQHSMRIDGKHLRYALETFSACFPPRKYESLRTRAVRFQDVLGELHDRDVFKAAVDAATRDSDATTHGITIEGLTLITDTLDSERDALFAEFAKLIAENPADRIRTETLDALLDADGDAPLPASAG